MENKEKIIFQKLSHLPLKPKTLSTLQSRGYQTANELFRDYCHSPSDDKESSTSSIEGIQRKKQKLIQNLSHQLNKSPSETASILQEVDQCMYMTKKAIEDSTVSAAAPVFLSFQQPCLQGNSIFCFCKSVDNLLGGGISTGEVTEIMGEPSVGKTQFAMQLCVNSRIPHTFGGVAGESIYIDTEGSFTAERVFEMAQALVDHVSKSLQSRVQRATDVSNQHQIPHWFTAEKILEGIHVYRVLDKACLLATICSIEEFLHERKNEGFPIKLIILDSIAFHFRAVKESNGFKRRTNSLLTLVSKLAEIATKFNLAVIVINQMTTTMKKNLASDGNISSNNAVKFIPSLGETWMHFISTKINLCFENCANDKNRNRICKLIKSPLRPDGSAYYCISSQGIRDASGTK